MAATLDEVTEEGTRALREWMADRLADGRRLPAPKSLSELLADRAIKEALAAGAVAILAEG